MQHDGACHCGAIGLELTLQWTPAETPVRACGCNFCRAHGARTVSDPAGLLELYFRDPSRVQRYRFGLETADFLLCRECGVYVAAVAATERGLAGTVNVNALADRDSFDEQPPVVSYDGESAQERRVRRSARWTPTVIRVRGAV
jgi:hypothetical protein